MFNTSSIERTNQPQTANLEGNMTMKLSHLIKTAAVILPVMTGPVAASAASVVTLQCNNFLPQKQGVLQNVISIQAGGGLFYRGRARSALCPVHSVLRIC
jgi:hypothetical protein